MSPDVQDILVFLDTEFSSLEAPELISLGLVAVDGPELYVEVAGAQDLPVSDFVRNEVLPRLGRHDPVILAYDAIAGAIETWCEGLRAGNREATIVLLSDSPLDWTLIAELRVPMPGEEPWTRRSNIVGRLIATQLDLRPEHRKILTRGHRGFEQALVAARRTSGEQHHALMDARALRDAWCAG